MEVYETDEFTEDERVYARCLCYVNNKEYVLSLIALQEINAFYSQKMAEDLVPNVEFSVKADSLDTYPYHLGDILFDKYEVKCDSRMRFCITFMCLETLQPPIIFLKVLEKLQGQMLDYQNTEDILKVSNAIKELQTVYAHSNEDAYNEIFKDLDKWVNEPGHECLSSAIKWYVQKIRKAININIAGSQIFPVMVCETLDTLEQVVSNYPIPLFKRDGIVTPDAKADQTESLAAFTFWMLKKVCALLVCQTAEDLNEYTECPFYKHCQYKDDVGKEYECKTSFWTIIQGEKKTKCPFGCALHTMGLWQNELVVKDNIK